MSEKQRDDVMKCDPIIKEILGIKERMAREAGYDVHVLCEQIRKNQAKYSDRIVRMADVVKEEESPCPEGGTGSSGNA